MHEAGVDRLVLASSMVVYGEGRYRCPDARRRSRRRRAPSRRWRPATSRSPARCAAGRWRGCWSTRSARLDPRSVVRREQGRPGALRLRVGPAGAGARRSRCATTTSTGRGCRATRPTPGVAAIFRSSLERGEAPRVFEDGGQARDFVHVADVAARQRAPRSGRSSTGRCGRFDAYNVCSGSPGHDPRRRRAGWRRRPAPASSRWSPASSGPGTYATSSRRRSGPPTSSASPPRSAPTRGWPSSRPRPLRA